MKFSTFLFHSLEWLEGKEKADFSERKLPNRRKWPDGKMWCDGVVNNMVLKDLDNFQSLFTQDAWTWILQINVLIKNILNASEV